MRSDFGDVNWTGSDGVTCLKYWMETLNTGKNATFWVKIAANLTSVDQTIYMYYGKSDATTTSNFDNTFIFGDPFDNAILNTNRWASVDGNPTYTISTANHYLEVTDMDASQWEGKGFHSKTITLPDTWIIEDAYDNTNGIYIYEATSVDSEMNRGIYSLHHTSWSNTDFGIALVFTGDAWSLHQGYGLDIGVGGNSDYSRYTNSGVASYTAYWIAKKTGGTIVISDSGTQRVSEANSEVPSIFHLGIGRYSTYAFGTQRFGAFKIRKYVSPEPSHGSWGSQETSGVAYTVDLTQTITTTLTPATKTDFVISIQSSVTPSFAKQEKTDYTLNPSNPITATFTSTPKTDFTILISNPTISTLTSLQQWNAKFETANPISIAVTETGKADFTLTIQASTTPQFALPNPTWNANVNPQLQPSITFEKLSQTNFILTVTSPVSTNWLLDIIHTTGVTYIVDLATSITAGFETVKQWFANIIITAEPSVTLTQLTKSDFILSFSSPITTGWNLDVTIPTITTGPEGGSWFPAKITLFTHIINVLAGVWQFTWTQEVPVSVNVTIINQSPYTSGTLHYRIINLDTNTTVVDWTVGEAVLIDAEGNTTVTIQTTVPIQRNFNMEHFKAKVKLSLISQTIEGEADFTVEKDMVKQFYSNVALLSLSTILIGIAVYSYKQKPEPWKKYPIEQKRKRYPSRKGKS
jgi:hypothetical protein